MKEIEDGIIGFGDCIEPATYKVHSVFHNAINYVIENRLVSLVTKEIGNGPANVVFKSLSFERVDSITISEDFLEIGNAQFEFLHSKRYISRLYFSPLDITAFKNKLRLFNKIVLRHAPSKSYTFLLDRRRKKHFVTAFEKALVERVLAGWNYIQQKHYEKGIHMIKGTGYGFTPSGDDFIAGMVTGLHVMDHLFGKNVSNELDIISRSNKKDNIISINIISHALRGHFLEKIKDLLQTFIKGCESDLVQNTMKVLALGETSGADFSTGLICAFKLYQMGN